jgi:hypothetical protein
MLTEHMLCRQSVLGKMPGGAFMPAHGQPAQPNVTAPNVPLQPALGEVGAGTSAEQH